MDEVSHRGNNSVETADIEATIDDSSMKLKESPNSQGFIAKIGNVRCFWHRANGVPRIVIGPEWFYSFAILFIAIGFSGINIGMMIQMIQLNVSLWIVAISACLVSIGLFAAVSTFLANPGIPDELFTGRTA
jgi:hypothetical protein